MARGVGRIKLSTSGKNERRRRLKERWCEWSGHN